MRPIKFRGKSFDDKIGWVYGFLCAPDQIIVWNKDNATGKVLQVDPETVGQSTGLHDKKGKEGYEGDIVKTHFDKTAQYAAYDEIGQVLWLGNLFNGVGIEDVKRCIHYKIYSHSEIIGNIHENPELLEAKCSQ